MGYTLVLATLREIWEQLRVSSPTALQYVVDILVVAYLTYRLLLVIRGSRAWRIIGGVFIYLGVWFISEILGLRTLHFILDKGLVLGPVALVILLLPELRQALEGFGKLGFWPERLGGGEERLSAKAIEALVGAANEFSATRTGALIVIERSKQLSEVERTGVAIDARLSLSLLRALFYGENPLHDGAVLIRGNKIVSAGCRLPSSDRPMKGHMHLRHRAAVGVTEDSDAVGIVVSEERGRISLTANGRIFEDVSTDRLRERMYKYFATQRDDHEGRIRRTSFLRRRERKK